MSGRGSGSCSAAACRASTWSSRVDRGELVADRRAPRPGPDRRCRGRRPTTTANPWSAIHCASSQRSGRVEDLAVVRAAVRAHDHGQRGRRARGPAAAGRPPPAHGRPTRRNRGAVRSGGSSAYDVTTTGSCPVRCTVTTGNGSCAHLDSTTRVPPAASPPWQPPGAVRRSTPSVGPAPHVLLGRLVGAQEQHPVGADRHDHLDLQVGVADRLAVDHQPAGTVAVGRRQQPAVGQPGSARRERRPATPGRCSSARTWVAPVAVSTAST